MKAFRRKNTEEIKNILTPIAQHFPDIKIIFTDSLQTYKNLVENVFIGALHQNYIVHALRVVRTATEPIYTAAKSAYKKVKSLKKKYEILKEMLKTKKAKLKRMEKQLSNWENKRKLYLK